MRVSRISRAPLGALRRLAVVPASRVRWKILAPFVALSLVVSLVGTYLATQLVSTPLEERFVNQLAEASRVTADAIVRVEQDQLEAVRTIAFTQGLPLAVARGDREAAAAIALPIAANSDLEFVYVVDRWGRLTFGAEAANEGELSFEPPPADLVPADWPFAAAVLDGETDDRGDKFAGIELTGYGEALLTAAPLRSRGQLVGVVVVGTRMSTIVAQAKQEALANVIFCDARFGLLASTLPIDHDGLVSAVDPASAPGALEVVEFAGRQQQLLYAPLLVRGEQVGLYAVALPTEFLTTAQGTTQSRAATFFVVLTIAVLLTGWSLSRLFTGPLSQLVRTSRLVASGDLTRRTGIRQSDEIGELAASFDSMTEALRRQQLGAMEALVSAVDARDPYTRGHSVRVGHLASQLGEALGLDTRDLYHLQLGGYFHDIGKIGIRDDVLLKPGALTPEEREMIQAHPSIGFMILTPVGLPIEVLNAVVGHHERLDGSGYPYGLTGPEVTIHPRIVTVADVWDALVTDRPYRAGMEMEQAIAILRKEAAGGLIDPDVVAALFQVADDWERQRAQDPDLQLLRLDDSARTGEVDDEAA